MALQLQRLEQRLSLWCEHEQMIDNRGIRTQQWIGNLPFLPYGCYAEVVPRQSRISAYVLPAAIGGVAISVVRMSAGEEFS